MINSSKLYKVKYFYRINPVTLIKKVSKIQAFIWFDYCLQVLNDQEKEEDKAIKIICSVLTEFFLFTYSWKTAEFEVKNSEGFLAVFS